MWACDHAAETAVCVSLSVLVLLIQCTASAASSVSRTTNDAQKEGLLKILASNLEHQQQPLKGPANDPPYSSHEEYEDTIFSLRGASRFLPQDFFTRLKTRSRNPRSTHASECPVALDGIPLFRCPSTRPHHNLRRNHNVVCIDDTALCDGRNDCPDHEDEDRAMCLFYRVVNKHLDILFMAMRRNV